MPEFNWPQDKFDDSELLEDARRTEQVLRETEKKIADLNLETAEVVEQIRAAEGTEKDALKHQLFLVTREREELELFKQNLERQIRTVLRVHNERKEHLRRIEPESRSPQ